MIAIGGNALLCTDDAGCLIRQQDNIDLCCDQVSELVARGYRIVLTHGNGPQVGNIMLQNELAKQVIPENPLDICGAQTQGSLGYLLMQGLHNSFSKRGLMQPMAALVSEVVVDENDEGFRNPTKFVGPFFSEQEAAELVRKKKYVMKQDGSRGYRRVVPSPKPLELVEEKAASDLLQDGYLVILAGGGGIPVVKKDQRLEGVEAVIDKDYTSALVAEKVCADKLIILTGVPKVAVNFNRPDERKLDVMSLAECDEYMREGQFPAGSMGPKVDAARKFVRATGKEAVITSLCSLTEAMEDKSGTRIVPERRSHE